MDFEFASAMPGLLGSLVGGSATITVAWITQKTLHKRELIQAETDHRETLYGEFITECSRLLMDALMNTLETPDTLMPAYALLNRIRLSASDEVLAEADQLLRRITEQYFASNLTVEEMRHIARSKEADPLKAFGEACRVELRSFRARF